MIVITNNPSVQPAFAARELCAVQYHPVTYRDILLLARDAIHKGHKLLTHPLSGSVKPGETPYKSLAISDETGPLDADSLALIEQSIITCDKFPIRHTNQPQKVLEDFQCVDLTLILSIF